MNNSQINSRQVSLDQRRPTLTTLADSIDGTRVVEVGTLGRTTLQAF
jgi:hypothetical protein